MVTPVCVLWIWTPGNFAILLLRMHRAIFVALVAVVLLVLCNNIRHAMITELAIVEFAVVGNRTFLLVGVHFNLHAFVADPVTWRPKHRMSCHQVAIGG